MKKQGFTLIELMIVVAIIAIIAAIAIPNLLQSRIRANEATAITAIKQIATAQVTFSVGRQGRLTTNTSSGGPRGTGFCDNYRNLYYGNPVGETTKLGLISQSLADAAIADNCLGTTATNAIGGAVTAIPATIADGAPYEGYRFNEPTDAAAIFATDYAITAVPQLSGRTGQNIYYVGQDGVVFMQGLGAGLDAALVAASPTPATTGPGQVWQ